jgi:hypothetical protein
VSESEDHLDRCWLDIAEKRRRREVEDGRIGLGKGPVAA